MHSEGVLVKKDEAEAEEWFRMAAEQGNPFALRIVELLEDARLADQAAAKPRFAFPAALPVPPCSSHGER